jgi:hypothetical protein
VDLEPEDLSKLVRELNSSAAPSHASAAPGAGKAEPGTGAVAAIPLANHLDDGWPRLTGLFATASLEKGLIAGGLALVAGSGLLLSALLFWRSVGFGNLDYPATMRQVVPGVLLAALGVKTILSSFFISLLGLRRRRRRAPPRAASSPA